MISDIKIMEGVKPTDSEYKSAILTGPSIWYDKKLGIITVPKYFITDYASVPAAFRWWQSGSTGPQRIAAYFHDYMYSDQPFPRCEADRVFREIMKAAIPDGGWFRRARFMLRREIMWAILFLFGWFTWIKNGRRLKKDGKGWRLAPDPDKGDQMAQGTFQGM